MGDIPQIDLQLTSVPIKASKAKLREQWKLGRERATVDVDMTDSGCTRVLVYTKTRWRRYVWRNGQRHFLATGKR